MAQIDDILSVLRHRIIEPFESGPPKPATQEMVSPVKHSAVVAMLRLAHPGRDDGAVVGDDYPSRSTLREVAGGSRRCARRRCGGPSCWKRRSAEMNGDGGAAPRPTESAAPAALVPATPTPQDGDADKTAITLLLRHAGPHPHRCRRQAGGYRPDGVAARCGRRASGGPVMMPAKGSPGAT
jgi:hypothetical protein